MIDRYNTPYGNVVVDVSSPLLVVRVSGGFDSALLLYLVAKSAANHNPDAIIQPITVVRANHPDFPHMHRVDNLPIVDNIVNWVRSVFPDLNLQDKSHGDAIDWWRSESYTDMQKQLLENFCDEDATKDQEHADLTGAKFIPDPYNHAVIDFCGITKNPPVILGDKHHFRELHRDFDHQTVESESDSVTVIINKDIVRVHHQENFRNADKRVVIGLAKQLDIFDKINAISRSCEGNREATDSWTKTCNTCWWCLEREWAISEVYK